MIEQFLNFLVWLCPLIFTIIIIFIIAGRVIIISNLCDGRYSSKKKFWLELLIPFYGTIIYIVDKYKTSFKE